MIKVGVAGPCGSGKTTFVDFVCRQVEGAVVLNADQCMKQVLSDHLDALEEKFGPLSFTSTGQPQTRNFYRSELHVIQTLQIIMEPMNEMLSQKMTSLGNEHTVVLVEWNLLTRLPLWALMDVKLFLTASDEYRLQRLLCRDQRDDVATDRERIEKRMRFLHDTTPPSDAAILVNQGKLDELIKDATIWAQKLKEMVKRDAR